MAGYFGTDEQQRLQALADASAAETAETPGACQAGRIMGSDDVNRFGWDRIDEIINRDGVFGFRLVPAGTADDIRARLLARGCRFDGATHVYELVSAANQPSRRMVESCGLRHESNFVCGVATSIDRARFTR